jgi:parallel beta-helix repeat protein
MKKTLLVPIALAAGLFAILACTPVGGPEVSIVVPTNGSSVGHGMITIKALATDDVGVTKVEFYVDGSLVDTDNSGTADTFAGNWDASNATNGAHTIKAKAYNSDNKTDEASVSVTVTAGGGPTEHEDDITADETWYPAGNPHIVKGTISVKNNATLTIKPGCVVKLKSDVELRCGYAGQAGAIVAVGTADSLITFTSYATTPQAGDWSDLGVYDAAMGTTQFKYCRVEYAGSSTGYGSIYIYGADIKVDNCNISNSMDRGIVVEGGARFSSFTNNTITTCAKYPLNIQANFAGSIGSGNTLTGNASGYDGIELDNLTVSETQTWLNHGVPYVIMGTLGVQGASSPILTIEAGTTIKLGPDVEFRVGYANQSGAIAAIGTASQPITFTSTASAPTPGSWSEIGVYDAATSATEFSYCNFMYGGSSVNYGTFYVYGATPKFDNCRISSSGDYGVVVEDNGEFRSFTNNTITTCAKYPVNIQADHAGTLGAGNTLTGNASGYDGIEVEGQTVSNSQTWRNHGVPYFLKGTVSVNGANSPELTIAPGNTVKLQNGIEFRCGYGGQPGAIIADGTTSPITFTAAANPPAPGSWDYISFYDAALSSSKLVNCTVEYGGGGYGEIYIYNATPTITGCTIRNSSDWGIYLDGSTYPNPTELLSNNTFSNNASGNVRIPPN